MRFPITAQVGLMSYDPDATDAHGNPKPAWKAAVPLDVYGYGPRSADGAAEPTQPYRDMVVIGVTVYGPPEIAGQVSPLDRMEVPLGGTVYEVDGEIGDWNHGPFGFKPGCTITLKRIEG